MPVDATLLSLVKARKPRFFEGLTPSDIATILVPATRRTFLANTVITDEGRAANRLFLVVQGRARGFCVTSQGQKITVLRFALLTPSPLLIALMQTAASLPVVVLGLLAGATADIFDRRRLLLFWQAWMLAAVALLSLLTFFNIISPWVLLKHRRCLVPADAFYEWQKLDAKTKQPFAIALKSNEAYAFAGLWERWKDRQAGGDLLTFTIITTDPDEVVQPLHDRMPVIIPAKDYDRWLKPGDPVRPPADLLRPFDADKMTAWKVDRAVGNVKNDMPELIDQIEVDQQLPSLFGA